MKLPLVSIHPKICVPRHADPVQLKPLDLELRRRILEAVAGPRVVRVVERPMNRIHVNAHINGMCDASGVRVGRR